MRFRFNKSYQVNKVFKTFDPPFRQLVGHSTIHTLHRSSETFQKKYILSFITFRQSSRVIFVILNFDELLISHNLSLRNRWHNFGRNQFIYPFQEMTVINTLFFDERSQVKISKLKLLYSLVQHNVHSLRNELAYNVHHHNISMVSYRSMIYFFYYVMRLKEEHVTKFLTRNPWRCDNIHLFRVRRILTFRGGLVQNPCCEKELIIYENNKIVCRSKTSHLASLVHQRNELPWEIVRWFSINAPFKN